MTGHFTSYKHRTIHEPATCSGLRLASVLQMVEIAIRTPSKRELAADDNSL
jgi:hypothetical protein